jgi:hypothetical protein
MAVTWINAAPLALIIALSSFTDDEEKSLPNLARRDDGFPVCPQSPRLVTEGSIRDRRRKFYFVTYNAGIGRERQDQVLSTSRWERNFFFHSPSSSCPFGLARTFFHPQPVLSIPSPFAT